ncbi:MAG: uroporphyrinogen-III C-methyltransferase [Candidatus Tectomicrobia bacterium]|uniref:uroporphyrinogen-III C-methyltransferase n=1 Tax=Tectimicrobiota bacterium TaxID=2528274 RepID=A0A932CLH2_UNCTE|nr:uroporphyrinogen-III C-methyltransferase [Candidatus Tectomicrobia bacterium]
MVKAVERKGKVYLVGAGPGDPRLVTLKGIECLREAEVVVYDHLASEELLSYAPAEAERIYAGKEGGLHTLSQGEINALILQRAQEGRVVVRLKGGDPFIFGRGGEEGEELAAAGITIEVVPGITSAIAVPAYAGIPVTHRDHTSTIAIITGHEDPTKESSRIQWDKISTGIGTLVFLMGVGNLPHIVEQLIQHGRSPQTPVAVIRWGTTAQQETVVGTLETIVDHVRERQLAPPAITVVGEVVQLRERLNWFERLPLFGRRVVVTRSREQASDLSRRLRRYGAEVLEVPSIQIVPPPSWEEMDRAIASLGHYHWVIFTSANGVRHFFARLLASGKDARALSGLQVCAIGPATAEELQRFGISPDRIPGEYRAEGILEALGGEALAGKRVLLPRAAEAREILPEELRKRGAQVDVVAAYYTVSPGGQPSRLVEMLEHQEVHLVTFTSSSTVRNFVELLPPDRLPALLAGVQVACIGPITARTARELGLETQIMPQRYTIPDLVEAIVEHLRPA